MSDIRNEVRRFCKQIENIISNPKSEEELLQALKDVNSLIYDYGEADSVNTLGLVEFSDLPAAKHNFLHSFYVQTGYVLLNALTVEWITSHMQNELIRQNFDSFFLGSKTTGSFVVLAKCLTESRTGLKQNKCVKLLEDFFKKGCLKGLMLQFCDRQKKPEEGFIMDEFISSLVSFPDKAANSLQRQNSDMFLPLQYVSLVGQTVLTCLDYACDCVRKGRDVSLQFLGQLCTKFCMSGFAEILWKTLMSEMLVKLRRDFVWCRICERLVTSVPDRGLDIVLGTVLKKLPWYGLVDKLLGDCILSRSRVEYLMCTKMLLLQYTDQVLILHNILGYLATSHTRRPLFVKTTKELLRVWGDRSALRHAAKEQHLYITKALLICCHHLTDKDAQQHKDDFLRLLLPGVQAHLEISDNDTRCMGMLVAKTLTKLIDPKGPKLEYEFDDNEDPVKSLLMDTAIPEDPVISDCTQEVDGIEISEEDSSTQMEASQPLQQFDLDSDDDLEPYDMSNDVKVSKVKKPKYIRDCMEGLISADDPERMDVCLEAAEGLVRASPDGLTEVCEEFAKILLHLSDKTSNPLFTKQRFSAMVALTAQVPVQVSKYLTTEFYERNYNLRQRMDILEVLAAAAQELSKPSQPTSTPGHPPQSELSSNTSSSSPEDWHTIVQRRIESKTRRFVKGPIKPIPIAQVNRFAGVAGHFFYPLMKHYDRKENTFDLVGEDSLILGRLTYTLGVIMYCAVNTMEAKRMGATLLEYTWVLRFHTDRVVCHAILFAVSMVILSVPAHTLLSDLQGEVMEMKAWLEDVVEKAADNESRKLAVQCLVLMENVIKKELKESIEKT